MTDPITRRVQLERRPEVKLLAELVHELNRLGARRSPDGFLESKLDLAEHDGDAYEQLEGLLSEMESALALLLSLVRGRR